MTSFRELVNRLFEIGAIQFGRFILTSGVESPYYLDLRRIVSYPDIFMEVVRRYAEKLMEIPEFDVVVGIETGSIPIAAVIAHELGVPMVYVRKKRKDFGAGRLIEGVLNEGAEAVIIEDVVTTGGSIARAVEAVRQEGGIVNYAISFIDRLQGGRARLKTMGVELISITDVINIFKILYEDRRIPPTQYRKVMEYIGGV